MKKFALALALVFFSMSAVADTKIAFIDGSRIISKYEPVVDTKLNNEFKTKQDQVTALQKKLIDESDKYNRDAAVMSDDDKKKMQETFNKDQSEFQRLSAELNKSRSERGNQELQKLLDQVKAASGNIAKKAGYTVVLQRAAAIYVADESTDITDQVLKMLDYK